MNIFTAARSEAAVPHDAGLTDITTHLVAKFGTHIDRAAISGVVRESLHDLQCSPVAARVVGLEHLARDRLTALIEQGESQAR